MTQSRACGRVAVFVAHYPPHVGGVERYTQCLWRHLARRGWQVLVVTTDTRGPGEPPRDAGVGVWRLPAAKLLQGRVPVPVPSRRLVGLLRALAAAPPDVLVSNTRFFPTSALAAALARRLRRPLLHIEHGSAPVTTGAVTVDRITLLADRVMGRWVVRTADRCVGVSSAASAFLRESYAVPDPGLLPNGVDVGDWDRASVDYRHLLGLHQGEVLVAYVGRLIPAKGVLDVLEAFAGLEVGGGAGVRLAVAGGGPLGGEVRRAAAADRRVLLLGPLRADQVRDLLLAADALVHPSAYPEGLPTVLLEAAAAGAAIVASPAGGTTDLVRHGETGLLVPAGDVQGLREAIARLAADAGLRERLAAAARRSVGERFDWPTVADRAEAELLALM